MSFHGQLEAIIASLCSSEGSSETSGKGTASSVTSRLYNGQTASSRCVLKEHNPEFNSLDNYLLEPKLRAREEAGTRHLERKVLALQEAC